MDTSDKTRHRTALERRATFRVVTAAARDKRNPVDVHVGSRLRARRVDLGMSTRALARAIGVDERTVDLMEDGRIRISSGHLYLASAAVGVQVPFLFAHDTLGQSAVDRAYEASVSAEMRLDEERGEIT